MTKIAIIGTGIAGNSAAWLLNQAFDSTVYEQNDYAGGHSNTVGSDNYPDVDTGFIVYNENTYPNLIALFEHLEVETVPTDMSFACSLHNGMLEYSGDHLFAQLSNIFKPAHYKMIFDILRFYKEAPKLLNENFFDDASLGQYLNDNKYSDAFINHHILPMAAAIWSTSAGDVKDFPVKSFVRFFVNHGLMKIKDRPQWYTVKGGSKNYVEKLTAPFRDKIKLNTAVTDIFREKDKVIVRDNQGGEERFDHVILACHTDQSLDILKDANPRETEILSCFPYAENTAYLHTDETLMPKRKKTWSSWNYLASDPEKGVTLSYWMNLLQPFIGKNQNLFVTLNPQDNPNPEKTIKEITYHHPQFTMEALKGWDRLKEIQGKNRIWFCGAWTGYGFHEDGISSGLSVAESVAETLGRNLKRPWTIKEKSPAGDHVKPV